MIRKIIQFIEFNCKNVSYINSVLKKNNKFD